MRQTQISIDHAPGAPEQREQRVPSLADHTIRVLVVEDNAGDAVLVRHMLNEYPYASFDIDSADSTARCEDALDRQTFDVVLLDYSLPGENGLEFLRSVRTRTHEIPPVIMLTGQGDEEIAKEAIRAGAYDYFPKGAISPEALGRAILDALQKARSSAEERHRQDDHARFAFIDSLTGLHNRRYLDDALERECNRAKRYGSEISCLMIDLDGFKQVNDVYGHQQGDALLREVATVLGASLRETDTAARYGGDEFCLLLPETSHKQAMQLAERLCVAIAATRIEVAGSPLSVAASIGVFSPAQTAQLSPDRIVSCADAALRDAKIAGKNRVRAFSLPPTSIA